MRQYIFCYFKLLSLWYFVMATRRDMRLNSRHGNVSRSDVSSISATLLAEEMVCAPSVSCCVGKGSSCSSHLTPGGATTAGVEGRAAQCLSLRRPQGTACVSALDLQPTLPRGSIQLLSRATVPSGLSAGLLSPYPNSHIQGLPFGLSLA